MKKKILHIISKTSYAGITSYAVRIIRDLPEFNHEIVSCYKGSAYEEILIEGIVCHNLIKKGNISYKYLLLKYFKIICFLITNRFNIIHYHEAGIGVLLLSVIFRKNAKVVHHLHGGNLIGDNTKQEITIIHSFLLKLLSNRTYQVAVAKHVYEEYKIKIKNTTNIQLIRNSVPYSFRTRDNIKNSLGYIGRFTKEKGFSYFNSIVPLLKADQVNLRICAKGEMKDSINNSLEFIAPSFQIEQFYENIDLLLFTSKAPESLPLVVLEAIAFDVGVIAYPLKGVVEILGDDYPLYFTHTNELLSKVRNFYADTFDRLSLSRLHQKRIQHFKFDEMISKINSLYDTFTNTK